MPVEVREIDASTHLEFIATVPSCSFLQLPSWAGVKAEWGHRSVGWYVDSELVGVGLVLTRRIPRLKAFLAYLPEGPVLPANPPRPITEMLAALLEYLSEAGAFMAKIGPPVAVRRWSAPSLKAAIGTEGVSRLRDVEADETYADGERLIDDLKRSGWTQQTDTGAGFGDVQPRYVFQVPLAGRSEADLLAGMNQLWRRNIKKAQKSGVTVRKGDRSDLAKFHPLYEETAHRDGFVPRGLPYFERMWDAMRSEDPRRIELYLAEHEGVAYAATTKVNVGNHSWYSYGASSNSGRDLKPSNAIQWQMIRDSVADGMRVYDMRGISDTLAESDPLFGLIRFKLGTGGQAIEYVGEWDFALRPTLVRAFNAYLNRGATTKRIKSVFRRPEGAAS